MDLQLRDKIVLITGGSKGIGLACAKGFLAEGAAVAIASRSETNLANAHRILGTVLTIAADLVDERAAADVVHAVERELGPVDVLVNSAGAARRTAPDGLTPHEPGCGEGKIARVAVQRQERRESVGQPFDPTRHEAVARVNAPGQPEMTIVGETARGYLLNGRVLRPAMVTVAMSDTGSAGQANGAAA